MTFQMRFSGWVLSASSHARTAISLVPRRSSTSTSKDQKHQHQYLPYFVGFSGCSNVHTCHVSPPSIVISTLVTFLPPPACTPPMSFFKSIKTLTFQLAAYQLITCGSFFQKKINYNLENLMFSSCILLTI